MILKKSKNHKKGELKKPNSFDEQECFSCAVNPGLWIVVLAALILIAGLSVWWLIGA